MTAYAFRRPRPRLDGLALARARDLAEANVEWARGIAVNLTVNLRGFRDEAESAALWGLWQAAQSFDPARGPDFKTHASPRVIGAVRDEMRSAAPRGYRRPGQRRGEAVPAVYSLTVGDYDAAGAWSVAADAPPVGWEVEYTDWVESLARPLSPSQRPIFLALYLPPEGRTHAAAAEVVGLTESGVGRSHAASLDRLRRLDGADGRVTANGR